MADCGHPMRDGPCKMDENHRGRHTTVAFFCDGCQKMRRGRPTQETPDVAFCFVCINVYAWGAEEHFLAAEAVREGRS